MRNGSIRTRIASCAEEVDPRRLPRCPLKRTYDAPRFQEDRLRPSGSRSAHAGSRGPIHCWPVSEGCPVAIRSASKVKSSEAQRLPSPSDRPVSATAAAAREPRRSPRPCWSGLAATTASSATRGRAARASGRSGRQIATATSERQQRRPPRRWPPTDSLGSASSRSVLTAQRRRERRQSERDSHDHPPVAARRIGPGGEDEREDDRRDEAEHLGQPVGWDEGQRREPEADRGRPVDDHPRQRHASRTAAAAIAGARTGSARQRTANASTRLGKASTR